MVKYFLFCILLLLLSCSIPYDWEIPEDISSIEEAHTFMMGVNYDKSGGDLLDNWKQPESTYLHNLGDCEDQAGLLANIFIYKLHYEDVKLAVGRIPTGRHMVVKYNGDYYNPQNVYIINDFFEEQYTMRYDTYLFLAEFR